MIVIQRDIADRLLEWRAAPDRKVLLLRGARQVGKTFSVRELAKGFPSYLEVNFEERPEIKAFFQGGNLSPRVIIEKLQAYFSVSIIPGQTLLFFDEIQNCPEALSSLRFFYEQVPDLHVVATGSLLEFALAEIPSFGVGRIVSLFMYPMSMWEFMRAAGEQRLLEMIRVASAQSPLDLILHNKAVELLRTYCLIGGLPGVVREYLSNRDIPKCQQILESMLIGYEDDFRKYKKKVNVEHLTDVFRASARQAGGKFVYSRVSPGASTYGYNQALELLRLAGLVYKVGRVSGNGLPLGAEIDLKSSKVIPFDLGVFNRLLGLSVSQTMLQDDVTLVNSGAQAEVLCGLELISNAAAGKRPELYYWAREARGSNAEVDYLVQRGDDICPIEVKAGTKGQMQSLYRYLDEKQRGYGVRTSLENFGLFQSPDGSKTVEVIPLYAIGRFVSSPD